MENFKGKLREILEYELEKGNKIIKSGFEDFPHKGAFVVVLEKPFSKPIYKDLVGIRFNNLNDPHYWKADYYDDVNNLMLICQFGGAPNYDKY